MAMSYYHGSFDKLPEGTILVPRPDYERHWGTNAWYHILEQYRPVNMISHKQAVFMTGTIEDVELAGGAETFIYKVEALGPVSKHDINWTSEIECLLSEDDPDEEAVREAAKNYWSGVPHLNESVWEFLTTKARIVSLVEE